MHEVSLGGSLRDYLTGEERVRTIYEDLRQALSCYLVEELGYARDALQARFPVEYVVDGDVLRRDADVAVVLPTGRPILFLVFCPGQVHTFAREIQALARLTRPVPVPLAVVTDMRDAELFRVADGGLLGRGLRALPGPAELESLVEANPLQPLTNREREMESRILHAYTGLLKTCCGESRSL